MSDDNLTRMLLDAWREHRRVGTAHSLDHRHEWERAPEWLHQEADAWVERDQAYRLLIGTRLADEAIRAREEETDR